MDGPIAELAMESTPEDRFSRELRAREKAYYEHIEDPDVLVVLRIDPDVAVARRSDEDEDFVRDALRGGVARRLEGNSCRRYQRRTVQE